MELSVVLTVFAGVILTLAALVVKDRKDTLDLLMFQAGALGAVELIRGLDKLYIGVLSEAVVDFSATFLLWTFGVALTPAIISRGISHVGGGGVSEPIIGVRKTLIAGIGILIIHLSIAALSFHLRLLPEYLDMLPLYFSIFSLSILSMVVQRDSIKVLIGLNMAENAFEPLMGEVPLILLALALISAAFVNVIAVFIISEGKTEFGSLELPSWRKSIDH